MSLYRKNCSLILCLLILLFACNGLTQNLSLISQERFVRIRPMYQSWTSDVLPDPSAAASPIEFYLPINDQLAMNLYTNQTSFQAENMTGLSGFGDSQFSVHYHLPESNLLFQVSANLPTGQKTLSLNEFQSSMVLGQSFLEFNMPSLGQGLNLTPGISWARPLQDNLILGLGAAFQYAGSFQPLEDLDGKYQPGSAVLLTGGVDYQFDAVTALSFDMVFTTFGKDKFDSLVVYQSGNKVAASLQFQKYFDFNHLRVTARFRSRAKSLSIRAGNLVEEAEKSYPDLFLMRGQYTYRVNPRMQVAGLLEDRYYFNITGFKTLNVIVLGAVPAYQLNHALTLTGHLKFMFGTFDSGDSVQGVDLAAGIKYAF